MKTLASILVTATEQHGGQPLDRTDMEIRGIDIKPLNDAQESIEEYMLRNFSISDESRIFGVDEWIGHPYLNVSEYVASVIASDQNAPEKVIQQLHLLPPRARARELAIRQAIVDGVIAVDPALLPVMKTRRILAEVS